MSKEKKAEIKNVLSSSITGTINGIVFQKNNIIRMGRVAKKSKQKKTT